ncbi:DUF2489 domain-containing protein [Oceanospirillum sanctuarii]|uniref:DUF2489 domain-containing protein n=1 Tax=Oceanospirillum sanctuarii TaxID=1434821 RepID=UPI000A3733CD|nr:DUF2489 domain-containing protein [Oceanospirillum sanctuarii]
MTQQMAVLLAVIAVAIIIALGVYALKLRKQVEQREEERLKALAEVETQARIKTMENIHTVCQALVQGQVDVMEACIRVRTLVDIIEPDWFDKAELKVFAEITRRGEHFATHQARKELPKQERMKQDLERIALEGEYHDAALEGARWLLQQKP